MPRPKKYRNIRYIPNIIEFMPVGETNFETIKLNVDELEAIRLVDLEGLEQEESAINMEISRGTFQRILNSARNKIANSLVNGKKIVIEGGEYQIEECSNFFEKNNIVNTSENAKNCVKKDGLENQCNGRKRFCRDNCKRYREKENY